MTQPQYVNRSVVSCSKSCSSIDYRHQVTNDRCAQANVDVAVVASAPTRSRIPLGMPGKPMHPERSPFAGRRHGNTGYEVVSRVPQPYYTSLSAVTAPVLVRRPIASPDAGARCAGIELGLPPKNLLGVRRRTTSPGRIWPAAVAALHGGAPSMSESSDGGAKRRATSVGERRLMETSSDWSPEECAMASDGSSVADCNRVTASLRRGLMSHRGNDCPPAQASSILGATTLDVSATDERILGHGSTVVNEARESMLPDHQLNRAKSRELTNTCEPTVSATMAQIPSPHIHSGEVCRVRSHTLPSKVHLSSKNAAVPAAEVSGSMQQSHSLSFTGLLSRMSPKSIRRLFSSPTHHPTSKHGLGCDTDVIRDSNHAVPSSSNVGEIHSLKKDPRRATLRHWFKGRRRSKENELNDGIILSKSHHDGSNTEPPLVVESSLDGCATTPIGGRLSSRTVSIRDEALGLVTPPLYVVEFPDDVDISPVGAQSRDGGRMSVLSPLSPDCVGQVQNSVPVRAEESTIPASISRYRQLLPPTSLEVTAVHKMMKPIFRFPTSSMESIGHCSLDACSSAETGRKNLFVLIFIC